jgi:hypothetical protein
MTYTRTALVVLACLCFGEILAQTGPAGVRNNSENRLWYKAEQLAILPANSALSSWGNQGGNSSLNAFESGNRRPNIVANSSNFNGFRSVSFDGSNDLLRINNSSDINTHSGHLSEKSYALVFRSGSDVTTRQVIYEEGGNVRGVNVFIENGTLYFGAYNLPNDGAGAPWPFQSVSAPIAPNTNYIFTGIMAGNSSETGTLEAFLNGVSMGQANNIGLLYAHSGAVALGGVRGDSYFFNNAANGNHSYFSGEIAEFMYYTSNINHGERVVLENYLSSKFNVELDNGDWFDHDIDASGSYDFELAGLCALDNINQQTDAQGRGILRFSNADNLDFGEFYLWAHNNQSTTWENANTLNEIDQKLARTWILDEAGDVGKVDLTVDLSSLNISAANDYRILVDEDGDGTFEDEEVILTGPEYVGPNSIRFSSIDISPGVPFTLGYSFLLLPVEWSNFDVISQLQHVKILWTTASETNNSLFIVERSTDMESWENVSYLDGAGNSDTPINYSVNDNDPLNGTSYYRVRQMDYSGMSNSTEIKAVERLQNDNDFELSLYPNPSSDYVTIDSPENIEGEAILMSLYGQVIDIKKFGQENRVVFSLRDLPRGTYFLQIISSLGRQSMEVVKE